MLPITLIFIKVWLTLGNQMYLLVFSSLIANQATLKDYELDIVISVLFVSSSGEAARVATARKTLLLCSAALHLPSHPPICLCVFTRKNKTCWTNPPCLCPHYSDFWIYFFLSVCWGVFTGYYYHPNYFFSFSAVSIQHFLFAFLIRLSVCFCLFSVAFQLLHLTRFGFFFSSTPCAYCLSYSLLYNST